MNRMAKTLIVLLACAGTLNAAQLYRWVDSKGNVEWRDTPPPTSTPAKNVEQRKVGENVISGEVPYSLQQATKNHPVTLWTSAECGNICDGARAHLAKRGIPYSEKTPQSDVATFKKISPGNHLPMLQVGAITVKGYLESEWDGTFDNAGYPRTAIAGRPKPPAPAPQPAAANGAKPPANPPPAAK